jgi:serine/threonine-protein kinase HipA
MTSDLAAPGEAFVWIWLPGATQPVVAGRLARSGPAYVFNYGQSCATGRRTPGAAG